MATHLEAHIFLDEPELAKIGGDGDKHGVSALHKAVGEFLASRGVDPDRSHHEALRNPDDMHAQEVLNRALGTAV